MAAYFSVYAYTYFLAVLGLCRCAHYACVYIYIWLCWVSAAVLTMHVYIYLAVLGLCCCAHYACICIYLAVLGLCRCGQACSRCYSSLQCVGFSLQGLSCGPQALEQRLRSCGARAWLLCGIWNLPQPRMETESSALAGGFSTTGSLGKSMMSLNGQHEIILLTTGRIAFI